MRLIDADALKKEHRMADRCEDCKRNARDCQYVYGYTLMDICSMLDDAPTVGGLINVKDGLPTQQGEYLVNVVQYCLGAFEVAWFDGKVWTAADGEEYTDNPANNDNTIGKVTHWMPLPEMPEEE